MISDNDIKKLKGVFATKTDLKKFATKTDLKGFATKADLEKFVTKTEFKKLDERVEKLDERTVRIAEKVSNIETRLDDFATKADLENMTGVLLEAMDKVSQGMDVMKSEYTAVGLQLNRHINDKGVHLQVRS